MANTVSAGGLKIDETLYRLVRDEIAPGTGVNAERFWKSLGKIVRDLGPKNRALLERRDKLQKQIDQHHLARKGQPFKPEEYKAFLKEIGYLQRFYPHGILAYFGALQYISKRLREGWRDSNPKPF